MRHIGTLSRASRGVNQGPRHLALSHSSVGYNNKILVSNEKFSLGKNENVNLTVPAIKSHKVTQAAARLEPRKRNSNDVLSHTPAISHKPQEPKTITHNDEKLFWYFFLQVVLPYGIYFDKMVFSERPFCMGHLLRYINHRSVSLIINHL